MNKEKAKEVAFLSKMLEDLEHIVNARLLGGENDTPRSFKHQVEMLLEFNEKYNSYWSSKKNFIADVIEKHYKQIKEEMRNKAKKIENELLNNY